MAATLAIKPRPPVLETEPVQPGPEDGLLRCFEARTFEFGKFRLYVAQRQLLNAHGGAIDLPSDAIDLLLYLVERPGEVLDESTLQTSIWPGSADTKRHLSACIVTLRRALGDTGLRHRFIVTVPGRGYQFVARVRMDFARGHENLPVDPPAVPAVPADRLPERHALWIASGATALVLTGLFAWLFWQHPGALGLRTSSVAILPFLDLSPGRDLEYFTDGIAEELINSLDSVKSLRVIGRGSAFAFKGVHADARSIGATLNVDKLLEGSVRISGEWIRISVRLVRTRDGVSLWSQTYDRRLDDTLAIQSAIASDVTAYLRD
jgi:transcriptional activator of cad operon